RRTATALLVSTAAVATLSATDDRAVAQTKDVCLASLDRAQVDRDRGKLHDASAGFIVCASNACPPQVRKDCVRMLDEVNAKLPSLLFVARDAEGRDLPDAHVFVDGVEVPSITSGRAS